MDSTAEQKPFVLKSKKRRLVAAWSLFALFIVVVASGFLLSFQSVDSLLWAERADNLTSVMNGISKTTNLYFDDNWADLDRLTARLSATTYADEASLSSAIKTIEGERAVADEKILYFYSSGRSVNSDGTSFVINNYSEVTGSHDRSLAVVDMSGANGDSQESSLFLSRFTTPLKVNGEEVTYLAKKTPSTTLDTFFTSLRPNDMAAFYLINQDGTPVYGQSSASSPLFSSFNVLSALADYSYSYGTSYSQLTKDVSAKNKGTVQFSASSTPYMLSYAPLQYNDWTLLLSVPSAEVGVAVANNTRKTLVYFTITFSAIVIAGAFVIGLLAYNAHQRELAYERQKHLEMIAEQEKKASLAKGTFLSSVSHDIRTPMNGIIGMLNIAKENPDDKKTVRSCLDSIEKSSTHLLSLINDVLDMSRIEAGKLDLKSEPFSMVAMLDACTSIIKGQLQNSDVLFTSDFASLKHPYVKSDKVRISRIVMNILGNSVKFTPAGHSISFKASEVSVSEDKVTYRFDFKDTGIGMSEEFQKRIFEAYSQEERPDSLSYKGTGLGMAITKRYVDALGGTIDLKSKIDEGTSFTVTLPLFLASPDEILSLHAAPTAIPSLKGKTILLVEDNEINLTIAEHLLKETGVTILSAQNGQEAVDAYLEAPEGSIDLILMDVMMPLLNGYEATEKIRASTKKDAKSIIIIAMTANAFAEDVAKAKASGMNDHLAKPIDKDHFFALLAQYLGNAEPKA
jgi:signal transduction histidine kinase/CheY-like chemotaxis protein